MVRLRFFGRLSDFIEGVPAEIEATSVADIRQQLSEQFPLLAQELSQPQLLIAVNQQIVDWQQPVCSGDEVAFMPPVTGG
jgi:molybdopterin synthase sulfur carrier subunit